MPQQHQTGPLAILEALRGLDLDKLEQEAQEGIRSGTKTARAGYVKRLNAIKGLRRTGVAPAELMVTSIPVIPPKFRPFAQQGDTLIAGDANILYKDFIEQNDAFKQERDMFGDANAGQGRLDLYDTAKALYGYGDPVKEKTRQKDIRGFLKKIVGRTSKTGYFQSRMISKTQDSVGRSTIIVDPELGMDEIGLPRDMAMTMYAPHVQRRLRQTGMADSDALKAVRDRAPVAMNALEREVEVRPVVYSRAPAWYQHNIIGGNVKLVDGDAISISPAVTTGMNADFDGDTINVHVPATDEAVKETYEALMPSAHPYDDRSGDTIKPKLKQEQVLGLYDIATRPASGTYRFATTAEALKAVREGAVPLDADLVVGDLKPVEKQASLVSFINNKAKDIAMTPVSGIMSMELPNSVDSDGDGVPDEITPEEASDMLRELYGIDLPDADASTLRDVQGIVSWLKAHREGEKVAEYVDPSMDMGERTVSGETLKALEMMYGVSFPDVMKGGAKAVDVVRYLAKECKDRLGLAKEAAGKIMEVAFKNLEQSGEIREKRRGGVVYMPDCEAYRGILSGNDRKAKAKLVQKFVLNQAPSVVYAACDAYVVE